MRQLILVFSLVLFVSAIAAAGGLDPYSVQETFCRFPFAKVIPLSDGEGWGVIYADTYGKLHVLRYTEKGWRLEWELTNLGAKIANFLVEDIDDDGILELVVATVNGRILIYSMEDYSYIWENLEMRFENIRTMEIANIDADPQPEFIIIAQGYLHIVDSLNKGRQWTSTRQFDATEIIVENVDKDDQLEIILNTGVVLDSRFFNVEVEWDKPFGERIIVCDMNNDGYPEVVGEFSDYSLRIFDVYAEREVW
jgi:hypothetical protein